MKQTTIPTHYYESLVRDAEFLECLDACGAPFLPIWEEAEAMFQEELEASNRTKTEEASNSLLTLKYKGNKVEPTTNLWMSSRK